MFSFGVGHGVYKLCTTNKTLRPIHHRSNLQSPPPPHRILIPPSTTPRRGRRTQVQSIASRHGRVCSTVRLAPSGPGSIYPGPSASPLARIKTSRFSNGAEEASPHLQRRPDATLLQELSIAATEGRFLRQWILFPRVRTVLLTSSAPPVLTMPTEGEMTPTASPVLLQPNLPIITTSQPYQASSSRCG